MYVYFSLTVMEDFKAKCNVLPYLVSAIRAVELLHINCNLVSFKKTAFIVLIAYAPLFYSVLL